MFQKLSSQFFSWWDKNALASEGPNVDPIATPSICLYNILLNMKYNSLVAKNRRSLNLLFFETMNNVAVSKKTVSATFNGFFKGDASKRWINI